MISTKDRLRSGERAKQIIEDIVTQSEALICPGQYGLPQGECKSIRNVVCVECWREAWTKYERGR